MAKDEKGGGSDKEKKSAVKGLRDMQDEIGGLRDLHTQLGKHLAAYEKNVDALLHALLKGIDAEVKKRWEAQQKLQTQINQVVQDVSRNKAAQAEKAAKAMDDYIRG